MFNYLVYESEIERKEGYPIAAFVRYEAAENFVKSYLDLHKGLVSPFICPVIVQVVELKVEKEK